MEVKERAIAADELIRPDSKVWLEAKAEPVDLTGVPVSMQPTAFISNSWTGKPVGVVTGLTFSALHNGEDIALRLEWADPSQDLDIDDNDHFPDGAAVVFPMKDDAPLITMGSPQQPVNAWHWRADRPAEARNNVATGIGTTRVTKGAEIRTAARYHDGHWQVVFVRALRRSGVESTIQLAAGQTTPIAFAVWEGSNGERGGLKSFSPRWYDLHIG
ncbi:MAG: ethylbenzene dehydrogenase [Deltaproteobacteria bacterium]|nr:ethylbenzene dehydrogenase [Deltaproteobacteria bacterium]